MGDINAKILDLLGKKVSLAQALVVVAAVFVMGMVLGYRLGAGDRKQNMQEETIEVKSMTNDRLEAQNKEQTLEANPKQICVEVSGAVMSPGVYCLPEGSLVNDALKKAGDFNFTSYAYKYVSRRIALAKPLIQSEKIYIPFADDVSCEAISFDYVDSEIEKNNEEFLGITEGKGESKKSDDKKDEGGDDKDTPESQADCISVNNATIEDLTSINGIGESTAQNIIDARPYEDLSELLDVSGIGQAKYELLLEVVCL